MLFNKKSAVHREAGISKLVQTDSMPDIATNRLKKIFWADMKNLNNLHCLELDQTYFIQAIFCGPQKK